MARIYLSMPTWMESSMLPARSPLSEGSRPNQFLRTKRRKYATTPNSSA